jgi:hypothetical protein
MGQTQASVASARDGSFGLGKLVAGSYTLSARPTAQAQRRSEDKLEVVETYFPNAIEEELALKIGLQAGATADGYNIRLQRVPVFSVRGMVRGADGQPAPDTRVMIGKRRSPASMPGSLGDLHSFLPGAERLNSDADDIESVMTAADGGFAFPSVREGDWMLQAESEWIRVGETDVQQVGYGTGLVSRRDVDGIELRLSKSFGLNAKVELMDEAKAPPNTFASLLLRPSGPGSYSFGTQDGEFGTMKFAQVVAGRYVVTPGTLGALNGLHLAAVYLGGVNVTGQPVDLTESSPPLRAVFKKGVGTIRGMLTGGPATILAIPRNSAEDPTIFSMEATPGVEFRIPGLAPGSYAVGAFDRVEGAGIFDQGTIQRLSTLSSAVKVEEDGVASVELHVNAWPE